MLLHLPFPLSQIYSVNKVYFIKNHNINNKLCRVILTMEYKAKYFRAPNIFLTLLNHISVKKRVQIGIGIKTCTWNNIVAARSLFSHQRHHQTLSKTSSIIGISSNFKLAYQKKKKQY